MSGAHQAVGRPALERFFGHIGSRLEWEAKPLICDPNRRQTERPELERFFADAGTWLNKEKAQAARNPSIRLLEHRRLRPFFRAVSQQIEMAEQLDSRLASDFNVFDLIEPDENKLSDILKLLLDPKGEHGQGDLFLRLLIERLGVRLCTERTKRATVEREAPTYGIEKYRRRIDVLVNAGALIAIENKVDSPEQEEQVTDYLEHLRRCASGHHQPHILIYLTPNGRLPKSLGRISLAETRLRRTLRCWSYQVELREWLEACRAKCQATRFQAFLSDFIAFITTALKREEETEVEDETNEQ